MGREIADFIALDENNKRVILIHAKAEGPHKVSASALQTVFGQVKKNLAFLQPMNVQKPPNLALWSGQWSCNKVTGIVDNRVRKGTGEPEELWKRITKVVRDPSSTREVWVLLGDEFSYSEFEKKRNAKKPASEILQIEFLILSTWQAISEVGAKFSILCSS
jgi:hypothetical protein